MSESRVAELGKPILEVNNLSLKYRSRTGMFKRFEHTVLDNIQFKLHPGETLGIIGRNGCGKSSLLRVLAGVIAPSSGEVNFEPGVRRALLALGLGFRPDLSGRDNALLSMMLQGATRASALDFLDDIQDFAELGEFFNRPVKTYSAGMRSRLGFATAFTAEVDVLLIDEILSVGDAHFRHKAEAAMLGKMRGEQSVVLVSHNAVQIERLCDQALWIEGGVIRCQGETEQVIKNYSEFIATQDTVAQGFH